MATVLFISSVLTLQEPKWATRCQAPIIFLKLDWVLTCQSLGTLGQEVNWKWQRWQWGSQFNCLCFAPFPRVFRAHCPTSGCRQSLGGVSTPQASVVFPHCLLGLLSCSSLESSFQTQLPKFAMCTDPVRTSRQDTKLQDYDESLITPNVSAPCHCCCSAIFPTNLVITKQSDCSQTPCPEAGSPPEPAKWG